jgi:hypothetical protein
MAFQDTLLALREGGYEGYTIQGYGALYTNSILKKYEGLVL